MYKEFDEYLSDFAKYEIGDSWYDDGCLIATEMLQDFTLIDWKNLTDNLMLKSIEWQMLYAYCVESNINDEIIIDTLVTLCEIDNDELFETCIDSLRSIMDYSDIKKLPNHKTLINKVKILLPKSGVATKKILLDFIEKLNHLNQ